MAHKITSRRKNEVENDFRHLVGCLSVFWPTCLTINAKKNSVLYFLVFLYLKHIFSTGTVALQSQACYFFLSQLAPNISLQQDWTTCYLTHQMLSVMLRIKVTVYRLMVQVPHQQRPFCVSGICFWYCSSYSFLRVHVLLFTQKLTMSKCPCVVKALPQTVIGLLMGAV